MSEGAELHGNQVLPRHLICAVIATFDVAPISAATFDVVLISAALICVLFSTPFLFKSLVLVQNGCGMSVNVCHVLLCR